VNWWGWVGVGDQLGPIPRFGFIRTTIFTLSTSQAFNLFFDICFYDRYMDLFGSVNQ
jgi:hypothetical protein